MEAARTDLGRAGITTYMRVALCDHLGDQTVKNQNKKV
jgi:hypothetical protein